MTRPGPCHACCDLLHEALNLTVRGRRLDAIQNRRDMLSAPKDPVKWQEDGLFDRFVERHNSECDPWRTIETRSLTPQLWAEDQFQRDLLDWEARARNHMMEMHP